MTLTLTPCAVSARIAGIPSGVAGTLIMTLGRPTRCARRSPSATVCSVSAASSGSTSSETRPSTPPDSLVDRQQQVAGAAGCRRDQLFVDLLRRQCPAASQLAAPPRSRSSRRSPSRRSSGSRSRRARPARPARELARAQQRRGGCCRTRCSVPARGSGPGSRSCRPPPRRPSTSSTSSDLLVQRYDQQTHNTPAEPRPAIRPPSGRGFVLRFLARLVEGDFVSGCSYPCSLRYRRRLPAGFSSNASHLSRYS